MTESHCHRNAMVSVAIVVLAFPHIGGSAEQREGSADVLMAPGPDSEKVIEFLEKIRKEASRNDDKLFSQDYLFKGRRSDLWKPWAEGAVEQSPQTMPDPDWGKLTLVQKNGKRRLELEWRPIGAKDELHTAYRLMDGESSYKLDDKYLYIGGNKDPNATWRGLGGEYFSLDLAGNCEQFFPLAQTCESVINKLKEPAANREYWDIHNVRCHREKGLLVLELERRYPDPENDTRYHNTFWIDPSKGCHLTKKLIEQRARYGGYESREQCEFEVREIVPGVFATTKVALFATIGGTAPKKDGRAGWRKLDLIIDEVKTHDFPFDEGLFNISSLPIPVGATVVDTRYDPPREFIHGEKPLNEELLQLAVARKIGGSNRVVFLIVNSALFVIIVWFVRKRWTGQGTETK